MEQTTESTTPASTVPTVRMQAPDGTVIEVNGTPDVLVPLMVQGYVQTKAAIKPAKGA